MAKGSKVKSCTPIIKMVNGAKVKTYACGGKVKK
jgi:hypothetical protein